MKSSFNSLFAVLIGTTLIGTSGAWAASPDTGKKVDKPRTFTEAEIRQIVLDTVMDHPEVIINSVDAMQEQKAQEESQQQQASVEAYKTSLFSHEASPFAGNPKGDVTIVEFYDFNCGYCKRSLPIILQLLQDDKNVKFVFKDYPVLAPSSEKAAKASIAMFQLNPERYIDFHAALFQLGGKFEDDNLASVAEGMGVDKAKFLLALHSDDVAKAVKDNMELAAKMGVRGVPFFIIGKKVVPGAITLEALQHEIAEYRAGKKKPAKKE